MQQCAAKEGQESLCMSVRCLYNTTKPQSKMNFWTKQSQLTFTINSLYLFIRVWRKEIGLLICNPSECFFFLFVLHITSHLMIKISFSHYKLNISFFQKLLRGRPIMTHCDIVFLSACLNSEQSEQPSSPCQLFSFSVGHPFELCSILWFSVMLHPALPCSYPG